MIEVKQLYCPGCGKRFPQDCDWCSDLIRRPAPMKMHVDYEWQRQRLGHSSLEEECAAGGPAQPPGDAYIVNRQHLVRGPLSPMHSSEWIEVRLPVARSNRGLKPMAKQVNEWEDSKGGRHSTEQKAIAADHRYVVERLLEQCATYNVSTREFNFDFKRIESYNEEALRPLVEYFNNLTDEARQRTHKHG